MAMTLSLAAISVGEFSGLRNMDGFSRSLQNPGLQENADGSVDVYFGPKAPAGKEANWVPTSADGDFEVLFRLYSPQKPLFDKTWKLPDIERVAEAAGRTQVLVQSQKGDTVPVTAENFAPKPTSISAALPKRVARASGP